MRSKFNLTLIAALVFALLVIGCGEEGDTTETQSSEATEAAGAIVDEAIEEAADAFAALKEEYLAGAANIVFDWDGKISSLEEKKNGLPELAQKPLEEPLKAVMDSKAALDSKYDDLKGAGEDTFNEKKDAFEGSVGELKTGYESLMGMF